MTELTVVLPLPRRFWTADEDAAVRDWYAARVGKALHAQDLADRLGRSKYSVCIRAGRLGLSEKIRYPGRKNRRKWPTNEESRAAVVRATKKRLAEKGHPRGARGLKHTPEHLERMRVGSKRWQETATPEQKRAATDRGLAKKLVRYGSYAPGSFALAGKNPYSRTKYGRRADLGDQFFRSSWEANYARFLNWSKARGFIRDWQYEARTFWFEKIRRGVRSYTPDFLIIENDRRERFVEVKGWMDAKSKTKIARMKRYHPQVVLEVVGQKEYRAIEKNLGGAILNWE